MQLPIGLAIGFAFGFLLQKGGVTHYGVVMGQLLLKDFTVLKVMMTAVAVGMIGIHAMKDLGWVDMHVKAGSWRRTVNGR